MPGGQGDSDTALSDEIVRLLGHDLRRLREDHAVVEDRNAVLEEENTRLRRELKATRRALKAKAGEGDVQEEEACILLAGNHYDQVKRELKESEQQREAEQAEHARVVEELQGKLARGKEKRAALRAALSETREVDLKTLLRCDELDILDPSDLHGFTRAPLDAWMKIGKALDEPRYHDCVWKCCFENSLWTTSKDLCVFLLPSHVYNIGTGSFKFNSPEYLPRLGDTRDLFHRDGGQKWLYCGNFKCEWSCSVPLGALDSLTRATPGTIARIKNTIVDRICAGGGPASRTAARTMLEDGSTTVACYGLTKIGYKYQVDLAMEAYTRESEKSKMRKRPADGPSAGHKNPKKKRKPSSS